MEEKENGQPSVKAADLHKKFGDRTVLDGIGFEVNRGEVLAVLGRSGTGKSVLLKLLIRLLTPDSGSVELFGQNMADVNDGQLGEIRKKVGFLFQNAALYDSLTVAENVEFPLRRHTKLSDAERKSRARELLASVGLDQDQEKLPSEISGGMQKRVGLARALALDPEVVLFDEPTAGLDPITAGEIGELIVGLKDKRKLTAVVVTHDIRGAKLFSDRVILMRDGAVAAAGTFEELEKNKDDFVIQFLGEKS
jgi:phospholipid/cholesterol/gamma-HCH transport system ATP-binding protein